MMKDAKHYSLTTISCFTGIFVQAIITNLTAILFVPMMTIYGFSYIHLGILVGVNFTTQVVSDLVFSGLIDKLGFRKLVLPACFTSFAGLLLFGLSPWLFKSIFTGFLVATIVFSAASGLLEVLLNPIIDAIPNVHKGPAMSLMHSFYAWGQMATIIITTLFLFIFQSRNWQIIVLLWAIVPLVNFFMFLRAPFPPNAPIEHRKSLRELIRKPFLIVAFCAIFFGAATEVIMNQFASSFMEKAVLLPKLTGDLIGMTGFAMMLGVGRLLFARKGHFVSINKILVYTSALAVICYIVVALSPFIWLTVLACVMTGFAASMLWPGTLIITAEQFPMAGSWIFALLAASGDIGAGFGPWVTSIVIENSFGQQFISFFTKIYNVTIEQASIRIGILFAVIFPAITFFTHIYLKNKHRLENQL
ncbi:MAG: MFS transporter [Saccharofermentanales bacterium]